MSAEAIDRRGFLRASVLAGGGLALDIGMPWGAADAAGRAGQACG